MLGIFCFSCSFSVNYCGNKIKKLFNYRRGFRFQGKHNFGFCAIYQKIVNTIPQNFLLSYYSPLNILDLKRNNVYVKWNFVRMKAEHFFNLLSSREKNESFNTCGYSEYKNSWWSSGTWVWAYSSYCSLKFFLLVINNASEIFFILCNLPTNILSSSTYTKSWWLQFNFKPLWIT